MYLNTYSLDHVFWSETRAWMALVVAQLAGLIRSPSPERAVALQRDRVVTARSHGGGVSCADGPTGGARFTLWLPPVPGVDNRHSAVTVVPHLFPG